MSKYSIEDISNPSTPSCSDVAGDSIEPLRALIVYTKRNLIKLTCKQIVFTNFRLIWNQTDVRLVPNQSVHGKYSLISGWFNKFSKRFLCVYILCTQFLRAKFSIHIPITKKCIEINTHRQMSSLYTCKILKNTPHLFT